MQQDLYVIVGLGVTGLSCAHYLARQKVSFAVTDTRQVPPQLAELTRNYPEVKVSVGKLDENLLDLASHLIVSPGISLREPSIAKQIARGKPVIGDIELFSLAVSAPVIAITGTNAKSTVTTLVGKMAEAAGLRTKVGGNLGLPALDLLKAPEADLYVLELSSFQLDTTHSLNPKVATVLNVTPDHMDRYATFADYIHSKQHIYHRCQVAVCNGDDPHTNCGSQYHKEKFNFTLKTPKSGEFGLLRKNNDIHLAFEDQALLSVAELPVLGRHYQANTLAALAIGYGYGLPMQSMLDTLRTFKGLPHRCQWVRERAGVFWYNDSKGTNLGATLAAIEGLGEETSGKLILIAGGVGKNADFLPLIKPIEKYVRAVVLIGEAAPILAEIIGKTVGAYFAKSMEEAVMISAKLAEKGDSVLLSPACASFDMFNNFEHRGNVFMDIVNALSV